LQLGLQMSGRHGAGILHCTYGVAVMGASVLAQLAVWPYIQPSPFLLLTLGVLLAGLHGEWAPGLLATALGAAAVEAFFLAGDGPWLAPRDVLTLLLFACVGSMVTWINVSRRRGLRTAKENEQWLGTTLRSIGDAVIATDRDGRVRFLNSVAEKLTGWPTHQAAGRPLHEVFHIIDERSRRRVESPVDRVIRAGGVVGMANHTLLVARDGGEYLVEDSAAPIRDEEGRLRGVVLVFRDSTERSRDDLRRILLAEVSEVLIGSLEVETSLAAMARLLVPRAADRVSILAPGDDDGRLEPLVVAGSAASPAPRTPEIDRLVRRVRETQRAELVPDAMAVPLTARGGRTLGVILFESERSPTSSRRFAARDLETAEDLGRRASVAVDNARLYRDAQEAIRVRDEFLAIASHELRTPLTTLLLQLDSLAQATRHLEPRDAARLRRKVDSSSRQAIRLTHLMDSLLDVSRITSGRLAITPEAMDLVKLTCEITERFRDQARAAGCELRLVTSEPSLEVAWDRLRVEQVLSNLLSNAIKYGAGQPIDLVVDRVGDRARVAIRDHGIGIDAADAERIFGRFERAVSPRHYGGLGLGLFIARQIVEAHGGEIHVGNGAGPGAELVVIMPTEAEPAHQRAAV